MYQNVDLPPNSALTLSHQTVKYGIIFTEKQEKIVLVWGILFKTAASVISGFF